MSTKRTKLRACIKNAWRETIQCDYPTQCINSEHALQAYFFHRLLGQLTSEYARNTRRIFVEPHLKISGSGDKYRYFPDLVICDSKQIVAVLELKYMPRGKPAFKKDLHTLINIATAARDEGLQYENPRYLGSERSARPYPLSSDVLFVWAGVHKRTLSDEDVLARWKDEVPQQVGNQLLVLHAHTTKGEEASID